MQFFKKVDSFKLFAEPHAWSLFKYSAYSEGFGWTLLIYGILAERYKWWASGVALPLGGSIHGTLYIAYVIIILAAYSSLGWTRGRAFFGIMISVVPYGTIGFELWAAKKRRDLQLQSYRRITVRAVIARGDKILALQPSSSSKWVLPGGDVLLGETAPAALRRILLEMTHISPEIDDQPTVHESGKGLELLFRVSNAKAYEDPAVLAALRQTVLIDEAQYIPADETGISKSLGFAFEQKQSITRSS